MICSYSKEFSTSSITNVENEFIREYLPIADGDAVKVYLYGLYLCSNPSFDFTLSDVATNLSLSEKDVISYFLLWEEFGLVSVISKEPFQVIYMPVKSASYSKPRKYKAEKYTDFSKAIQSLITSRMISTNEFTEYFNIMETYGLKPEALILIVKYCTEIKGGDISYKYISKVAKDFSGRGILTVEQVEKELSSYVLRTGEIEKIFKAMSIRKKPDIEDSDFYKKWTQDLSFEPESIYYAAKSIKKGSMKKLDEFLMELYSMKCFTPSEIDEHAKKKSELYDLTVKINKALSVYVEVLDTVIDTYTAKWLSYGYTDETLLLIANHCFKVGKNQLNLMDETIQDLYAKGFVDISSVNDKFENEKEMEAFIKKVLSTCGINRRPNSWDKDNLTMWKSWNFSENMILEAAKLASGKSSPIAYINGVLSNWKKNNVFSLSEIDTKTTDGNSQEDYNKEYERRRAVAVTRAQKNMEKANELEGFSKLYARLFSLERDLAFAEISKNDIALKDFEKEQKEVTEKIKKLLSEINLDIPDLSPKYACEKCKDTGYVGTHRCDCFNKTV